MTKADGNLSRMFFSETVYLVVVVACSVCVFSVAAFLIALAAFQAFKLAAAVLDFHLAGEYLDLKDGLRLVYLRLSSDFVCCFLFFVSGRLVV